MLCDNAAFLDQVGAWKSETGRVAARRASQFWLMGLACSAVGAGWQTVALRIKESEVRGGSATAEKGEEAVELKKIARYVDVHLTMARMKGRRRTRYCTLRPQSFSSRMLIRVCSTSVMAHHANISRRERSVVNTQLLSDICDMAIPASALSYGYGYLDDGIVGLAGTVSSLLGVTAQWSKTA